MRHQWADRRARRLTLVLVTLMSALPLVAIPTASAHPLEAGADTADTITLALDNGPIFSYGGSPVPTFMAVVILGSKPSANYFWTVTARTDDGATFGGSNPSFSGPNGLTMTFSRMTPSTPIPVGQRTATASFTNPETHATVTSAPVSFTINKATAGLGCSIDGTSDQFEGVGQTLHIRMAPATSSQVPVDWQNGTYDVTLNGPTHIAESNLAPDSNDEVTMTGPSQKGLYILTCTFSGTASFTPASYTDQLPFTFSLQHPLGTVQLFTNPTTLTARVNLDFYLVFHAAPGLPAPTGELAIYMGNYYATNLKLSSNGDLLVHFAPLASVAGITQIAVHYFGDVNYNDTYTNFPLTNPAIPGNGGSGGAGGGSSKATATSGSAASPTAAQATASAATPTAQGNGISSPTSRSDSNTGLFLLVAVILLVLAGFGSVAAIRMRMKHQAKATAEAESSHPPDDGPVESPVLPGQSHADISPFT